MADPAWDWVWNILGINNPGGGAGLPTLGAAGGHSGGYLFPPGGGALAPGSSTTQVTLPLVMAGAAPGSSTIRANVGGIRGAAQGQGGVGTRAPAPQLNALGNPANRSSWFDYESAFKGGWPKNVTGGTAPGSYDYRAMQQAGLMNGASGTPPDEWAALFESLLGGLGGSGGGADNSLGYAQLAQQQEEFAARMALEQQALAQQAELARLQREEQRRQVAMQIGQAMNELTSRNWETGLPWTLPKGTQYAPGAEPGGALEGISRIGNVAYTPQRLVPSNPPSRETMEQWLNDALAAWGR